jgi:uncharacterized protein YciI
MNDRRVDQLYLFMSTVLPEPPATSLSNEEIAKQHHAYIQDLKEKGTLMGAGSMRDADGQRYIDNGQTAGGIIVVRGNSLAEAQALAQTEPYCREGQRAIKVVPWQRTWFED